MPSVGSTPTSSPAVTSAFSQPATNCQQISFNSFHQHRHSSVSNILSDTTQTASTTTSSTSSTPIHSPPSHTSLDSIQSNQQYINTSGGIINPLSFNCQHHLNISQMVVATISNDTTNNLNRNQTVHNHHHHHHNNPKYSKFMIITPAVSIDRNFDSDTGAPATNNEFNNEQSNYLHYCYNLNSINNNSPTTTTTTTNTNSINNANSLLSNYNSTTMNDNNQPNHRLLSKTANGFYRSSSWRWCTFICAAMRCFGGGRNTNAPYTTTFSRKYTPLYSEDSDNHRRRSSSSSSSGTKINFTTTNRLLRNQKNIYKNYEQPSYTTPRKTRDHLNNITYEL